MTDSQQLQGRRLLVVEDDYFLAEELMKGLQSAGAEVVGRLAMSMTRSRR